MLNPSITFTGFWENTSCPFTQHIAEGSFLGKNTLMYYFVKTKTDSASQNPRYAWLETD